MTGDLPELRASDADRDRVAEVLRDALAEGRLGMEEFDERLEAVYKARTYGELTPLTADLPASAARMTREAAVREDGVEAVDWPRRIGGHPSSRTGIAVMGGFSRAGRWTAPRVFHAFALMAGGDVDLREANFEEREITIRCFTIMGGIDVVVPPGIRVDVRGFGLMGGFEQRESDFEQVDPSAPRVVVTGLAIMGGVDVRRKLRGVDKARIKARIKEERRRQQVEERRRGERG